MFLLVISSYRNLFCKGLNERSFVAVVTGSVVNFFSQMDTYVFFWQTATRQKCCTVNNHHRGEANMNAIA